MPRVNAKSSRIPRKRIIKGKGAYINLKQPYKRYAKNALRAVSIGAGAYLGRSSYGIMGKNAVFMDTVAKKTGDIIFGQGAYKTKLNRNSLIYASPVPAVHSVGESIRIRHTECLYDISSSTTSFVQTRYAINPAVSATFPWLSTIASSFQEYRFEGLIFEFRSSAGESINSASNNLGSIMMTTQYNPYDLPFINKNQLLNESGAVEAKPSQNLIHGVECSPQLNTLSTLYTRYGAAPAGSDIRLFDLGVTTVATYGSQAVNDIGSLYVSYDVVLIKSKIVSALALTNETTHFSQTGTSATLTQPLISLLNRFDFIGITITGGNTIVLPVGSQGKYFINLTWAGTTAQIAPLVGTTLTNATIVPSFTNNNYVQSPQNTVITASLSFQLVINIIDPSVLTTILILGVTGTFPTGTTGAGCDLYINQINNAVV
nr:putative capsid protein [Crucivirus sp.]